MDEKVVIFPKVFTIYTFNVKNYIQETKNWIDSFVIQYNLCPFAKKPFVQDTIRYVIYEGEDWEELGLILQKELGNLEKTPKNTTETTIIIIPAALSDFNDYLDYLAFANRLIFALRLDGVLQIASFHPDYQFAETEYSDVTNFTNRSPFPLLHLLREESVEQALAHYDEPESIPEKNMETMRRLFE